MPMDKKRYPKEWNQIAAAVKEAAGWKCQKCGKQCRRPGDPFDTHKNTLTVAHLNHTPEDVRPENLMAMCAPCHLQYDAKHHAETRRNRKMKNDTISRQETLEHLRKRLIETAFNNVGYECDAGKVFEDASKRLDVWLSEVPSADTEAAIVKVLKMVEEYKEKTGTDEIIIMPKNGMKAWDENGVEYTMQPERKSGKWIPKGCNCFGCNQCGEVIMVNAYTAQKASDRFKFCPNCGCKMEG